VIHVRWQRRALTPEQLARGEIRINCPKCGARNVPVKDVWFEDETLQLVIKNTTSWVQCSACDAVLLSRDPADTLPGRTADELDGVITDRVSPIVKVLVVIACFVFFMPGLGLVSAIVAAIATWRRRTKWRLAARVALVLSILAHIGIGLLFLLVDDSKGVYQR
jgi:succinate dehydrogenase hydrophobic anchor subunit